MTPLQRTLCISSLLAATALLSNCSEADSDHFWGLDAKPGYNGPSTLREPGQYQAAPTDSFYEQQNAAREANMKAVREQQYKNDTENYRNGYRDTLPNY
ncbi:MAG: hypothetical protein ABI600_16640 [Luteolibacter sp.]